MIPVLLLLLTASPELLLERMRAAQARLESLEARLEQEKTYPQLGIEDPVERGRLYLEPGKLRIEIETPERRVLVVNEGRYAIHQPRIRQTLAGNLSEVSGRVPFSALLSGSPDAIRELTTSYRVSDRGEEVLDGSAVRRLHFEALPGSSVYCTTMELFIDTKLLLPVRQTCREPNGSEVTVTLRGIERDRALPRHLFDLAMLQKEGK